MPARIPPDPAADNGEAANDDDDDDTDTDDDADALSHARASIASLRAS